jgi:hypothetical protein
MNGPLHNYCASHFFLLAFLGCIVDCIFCVGRLFWYKLLVVVGVAATVWYGGHGRSPHRDVITEYLGTHLVIAYMWLLGRDQQNLIITIE